MAKSIRANSRRKARALVRVRNEPKERKRLEATVQRMTNSFAQQDSQKPDIMMVDGSNAGEVAKTGKKLNLKTMRYEDGTRPVWLSQRTAQKTGKAKDKKKAHDPFKKTDPKKKKGRRHH